MLIIFEFQATIELIRRDNTFAPISASAAALQETYYVLPVRLLVNGIELLEAPNISNQTDLSYRPSQSGLVPTQNVNTLSQWLPLPIIHPALVGLDAVKRACAVGVSSYLLPGTGMYLQFNRAGTNVTIYSTLNKLTAQASCEELIMAFEKFAHDVRVVLNREVPELKEHPVLGIWLSEGE